MRWENKRKSEDNPINPKSTDVEALEKYLVAVSEPMIT